MPSIPDAQLLVVQAVVLGNVSQTGVNTKNVEFVFHFRRLATTFPLSKAAFEVAFQSNIAATVIANLNAAYTQTANQVRCLNDATDANYSNARSVVGGITGDQQQNFDTLVLQYKTGYRGKSGRGSKHFAPLTATDTLGNTLVAGTVTAWQTVAGTLAAQFTDGVGNVWRPVILSRKLSQLKTNPTVVFTNDVTNILLNKTTGTMKKRKVKTIVA